MAGHRPFRDLVADRMKDWSPERRAQYEARKAQFEAEMAATAEPAGQAAPRAAIEELEAGQGARFPSEIGRESVRERVWQSVLISVVAGALKTKERDKLGKQ